MDTRTDTAGLARKTLAFFLDAVLSIAVGFDLVALCLMATDFETTYPLFWALTAAISALVFVGMPVALPASFGGLIAGIMTGSGQNEGQRIPKPRLLALALLRMLWPIDLLFAAFSSDKSGLGERIAGARTVRSPAGKGAMLLWAALGIAALLSLSLAGSALYEGLFAKTDIYRAAISVVKNVKENGNDDSLGGIARYDYLPIQVKVAGDAGSVALKFKDRSNQFQYLSLRFSRYDGKWEYVNGSLLDSRPKKLYSIEAAKRAEP
jgi:hypothetical protein